MNEDLKEDEHDYKFIGRVGLFTPVIPGAGGGILLRKGEDKFGAATGTKKKNGKDVYRWLESYTVKELGLQDKIDMDYYNQLAEDAIDAINKYGDFERFVSDDYNPYWMNIPETDEDVDELPFD